MKTKCKALALDIDGTLTNSEKKVTKRTATAVQAAMDRGIHIILASGRPVLGLAPIARDLGMYDRGGFILAYNGGQIVDCKTGEVIFEKLLPVECYAGICAAAREMGLHAMTYDENGVIAESDDAKYLKLEAFNNRIPIKKVDRLEDEVTSAVPKFMIVGEAEKTNKAIPHLQQKFSGLANVFMSEPYFIEFTCPGIEKSSSLAVLIKHLNVKQEELFACGDGLNDLTMFNFAGYTVAMANARTEIKSIANHITLSNDEDGVADFLEKFVL